MSTRPVRLEIDELVLDGLGPLGGGALGRAVEAELAGLLAERGARVAPREARSVDAGALPPGPLAASIAAAVHRGLSR